MWRHRKNKNSTYWRSCEWPAWSSKWHPEIRAMKCFWQPETFSNIYLELAPGVEFLQTVDCLLSVHHWCHALALLKEQTHPVLFYRSKNCFSVKWFERERKKTHADPWVLEGLGGGDPLSRIHGQHLVDQVLGLRRHRVPLGRWILHTHTHRERNKLRKLRRTIWENSRRRHQLWFERTAYVGPRPRTEGSPPARCTKSHLRQNNKTVCQQNVNKAPER